MPTEESDEENPEIVNEEEPHCDVVILTKSGRYTYFGNLDEIIAEQAEAERFLLTV